MSAFEELGLHSNLCELLEKNGIDLPTAIQQESIPLILGGGDVCASAETGTGKTLSFIISSLQIVHELFRNIGTFECNNENSVSANNVRGNKDNDESTIGVGNKKGLVMNIINRSNSRVTLNNALNECICNSDYSNSFEEVKVECEIIKGMYAFEVEILGRCFLNVGFCPSVQETLKYNYTYCSNGYSSYKDLNEIVNSREENDTCERKVYYSSGTGCETKSMIHENKHILSIPTSTPKTEEMNKKKLYCIVLCPTRDLAMQTYNNYLTYAESFSNASINIGLLVGGEQLSREKRNDHRYNNILVCTCFKLMECIKKNTINMSDIRMLILDEADELINNDERSVLEIKDTCIKHSHHVQTCFFSATLQDKNVKDCISKITNKPIFVDLKYGKNSIPSHIYVCIYYVNNKNTNICYKKENSKEKIYDDIIFNEKLHSMNCETLYEYTDKVHLLSTSKNEKEKISLDIKINKLKKLIHIINVFNMQNGIIFCRTNLDCDNLYNFLNHVGDGKAYKGTVETMKENKYSCVILKGKMSNVERKNNLDAFKKGEVRFLICTDVAARGIDIQNLRYLIILTLSENINAFFHKIGRVGRDGKNSLCIVLSSENQEEKVWFHTCQSRGVNCFNRNLKENKGCTVYIKESEYINSINNMLEIPMHVLDPKYYYAENVVDPLNYLKNNPVSSKSRRNKNQNANTIFSEPAHTDVIGSFASNIENIKKLQSVICYRYYESVNFTL